MNNSIDVFAGIFAFSLFFWGVAYLFFNLSIVFIDRRYKQGTGLIDTAFFKYHVPFLKDLPDFLSAGFFATHLMICVWAWPIFGKKKVFVDIEDPAFVTSNFTRKEIRKVQRLLFAAIMLFVHGMAYFVFRLIWPEVFG